MSTVVNVVRGGFYLDSVALMRLSRTIAARDGIEEAALMMGTPANRSILAEAGLLAAAGEGASGGDLIIAIRGRDEAIAAAALAEAENGLDAPRIKADSGAVFRPRSLGAAVDAAPNANLALISVPGPFAAAEARKAIRRGLNAMIFSDNVALAEEAELKREAQSRGRLVMGPDCGTAILGGVPLAFANAVPRGDVGIVGASGTGIQEVSCLIARAGGGISHAIGVGGRDLSADIGGISTLMAIDALAADPDTARIVLIAKPPAADVARAVLDRLGSCGKPAIVCLIGAASMEMPTGVTQTFTLRDAALAALGRSDRPEPAPAFDRKGDVLGLFSGGTLAAEAQVIFRDAGQPVRSNSAIPGADPAEGHGHLMLDLGDDAYTQGRPHPMIEPAVRDAPLIEALARTDLAAILVDVVVGHGAHPDPAGHLADVVATHGRPDGPTLIASVTGTENDPQRLSAQAARLASAGIAAAPSNAEAALWALSVAGARR